MSQRYPGVARLPDGRIRIRWTVVVHGRRKDNEETLDAQTSIVEAAGIRAERIRSAKAPAVVEKPDVTLGAYANSWLDGKLDNMKPTARLNYIVVLAEHILPVIGHVRVQDLTREHVQQWVTWAEKATWVPSRRKLDGDELPPEPVVYSRATVLSWWAKVRQVCGDAAADYGIADPCLRVPPPKCLGRKPKRERRTLSVEELQRLLETIARGWHAEVYTDVMSGLRPGELYALEWRDIDFTKGLIYVRRSHHRSEVGTTKTGYERIVPMGDALADVLRAHRKAQMTGEQRSTNLVFPASERSEKHGWYRMPQTLRNQLLRAATRAGIEIRVTPQVLRRTFNTLLVAGGVDRLVLRSIVGHTTEEMTERYHGAREETKRAAIEGLEAKIVGVDVGVGR